VRRRDREFVELDAGGLLKRRCKMEGIPTPACAMSILPGSAFRGLRSRRQRIRLQLVRVDQQHGDEARVSEIGAKSLSASNGSFL